MAEEFKSTIKTNNKIEIEQVEADEENLRMMMKTIEESSEAVQENIDILDQIESQLNQQSENSED